MKILVADDDAVLRNELAGLLREDGHDVVGASEGGEALRLVERESFDAALFDLRVSGEIRTAGFLSRSAKVPLVRIAIEDGKLRARVVLVPMGLATTSENEVTEQVMNLREPSLTV